jgi:V8-like Glu-specific endopeptidase
MPLLERIMCLALVAIPFIIACSSSVREVRRVTYVSSTPVENGIRWRDSVVKLHSTANEEGKAGSQATGFAVDEDHIVTAGHYCDGVTKGVEEGRLNKEILVIGANYDGTHYELGTATIVARHKDQDLCLLKSPEHLLTPLPILPDIELVETEDNITVIGAPKNYFPVRRDGRVISLESPRFFRKDMLFLSVDIQKGSSGSPVIWNGYVIGVIAILPYELHDAALAVRGDYLVDFIEKEMKPSK